MLQYAPLLGRLLASPTNIRLGWKGLPGTNTLAYYENLQIMAVKSFILRAPGLRLTNLSLTYFAIPVSHFEKNLMN